MYLIRKISPWQDQNRFYPLGNPIVGLFHNLEEAQSIKNEWEIEFLKKNGITNTFEYWDVDCTNEIVILNKFLNKEYGIKILNEERNTDYSKTEEVIPTMFPYNFSNKDYLSVQEVMKRYYYKIEAIENSNKYALIFNNNIIDWLNEESSIASSIKFKFYDSKKDALEEIERATIKNYNRCSNGTYNLVGPINRSDFTNDTKQLLLYNPEIKYDNEDYSTGKQFKSQTKLDEIDNGFIKLMQLLKSVNKGMYEIRTMN